MKIFKIKKSQLVEFVREKKSNEIYNNIIDALNKNKKFLSENVSLKKANQSIIDNYFRKGLIDLTVLNKLIESKIIKKNHEIID